MPKVINKITASVGGGSLIFLDGGGPPAISISEVVHVALLTALVLEAPVELEFFKGSQVIKRVLAFEVNKQPRLGQISRLATQMNPVSGQSHLEVFLIQKDGSEKAFNVGDAALQQLCHYAALKKRELEFSASDNDIVSASLRHDVPS